MCGLAGRHSGSTSKPSQDTHTQISLVKDDMIKTQNLCSVSELAQLISLTSKTGLSPSYSTGSNKTNNINKIVKKIHTCFNQQSQALFLFHVDRTPSLVEVSLRSEQAETAALPSHTQRENYMKHFRSCGTR